MMLSNEMNKGQTSDIALPDHVDVTPEWGALFRYAVALTRAELPKESGREFVIQMLEFGERLYRAQEKI
jgi:hypothetical protein